MKNQNVEAAESYINGLRQKDLSKVLLAADVVFEGPLSPDKIHGAESLIEFLSGIFPIIKDARIKRHIAEDDHICLLWELETTTSAVIPVCEYFRISDGLIKEMRPYYDPRPITNPVE